jgi:hypothetical protein
VILVVIAVVFNEVLIARYLTTGGVLVESAVSTIRRAQMIVGACGIALLGRAWIVRGVSRVALAFRGSTGQASRPLILVLGLGVPWLLLLLAAEPDRPTRFLWLWAVQVVVLACFAVQALRALRARPWTKWLVYGALTMLIAANGTLMSRLDSWAAHGWAGADAHEVDAVDFVAAQLRQEGRDEAAIGYQTFIYRFMANYNALDPDYKVGAEMDLLLAHRHGIENTNGCAEGIADSDEYRIVQATPHLTDDGPRNYIGGGVASAAFSPLRQFGPYLVVSRD